MSTICKCSLCRRSIRLRIEQAFTREPRWMGEMTIRFHARLSWVPVRLYRSILAEMVLLGLVLKSSDPADEFPRYLLSRLMASRGRAEEGGNR
jgi:hypothetical protein